MSISNLIKCVGLVTYGSEISIAEGSLRQALNINVDEDGVITPRRGFNDYGLPTTGLANITKTVDQIMEYKNSIIRQFDGSLEYEDTNNVFQSVTGTFNPIRSGYRTKYQEANSNLYFTSDEGIKKISETSQANLNTTMVKDAGGLKAGYADGVVVPTIGGVLPPKSKVAYRVLFGTKDNNNNLIYGSPSARFVVTNYEEDRETYEVQTLSFDTATGGAIANGDHFIFYSGTTKYVVWFKVASGTAPKTSLTIGGTYVEVNADGITLDDASLANFTANEIATVISNVTVTSDNTSKITITQQEIGDVTDISSGYSSSGATIATKIIGAVTTTGETVNGLDANVQVSGIVPNGATTDYFYQIYRTAPITATTGLTLNDIDPGDEMNLVYEAGLTLDEISASEFVVVDTTPESFRNSGLPLYTNEASGEGILQSNNVPPTALDVELFKNYMFYANTKQTHQLEFTIVSVDNFLSGNTKLVIGNADTIREYTFVGEQEIGVLRINSVPTAGDYITMYSANDTRYYYIYFGETGDNPNVTGAIGYRISISDMTAFAVYNGATVYSIGDKVLFNNLNYTCISNTTGIDDTSEDPSGTTSDNTYWAYTSNFKQVLGARIQEALVDNIDFELTTDMTYDVTYTYTNNGYTTGFANGVGSSITVYAPSTDGTGELTATKYGGDILLSNLASVGQAIDQTARSLVKVISSDPESPVNAYYLSTGDELPGEILLEARTLEDKPFYLAIDSGYTDYNFGVTYSTGYYVKYNNLDYKALQTVPSSNYPSGTASSNSYWEYSPIGDEFTPEIPSTDIMTSFKESVTDSTLTTITHEGHGLSNGDTTYVGYFKDPDTPSDPASFSGIYTVSNVTTDTFDIAVNNFGLAPFTPDVAYVFNTSLASDNEESPNRVYYSKYKQPEAVPRINYIDIGPQDAEILRILALRDELYVLKEDGVYIISGSSAPDPQTGSGGWSVRLIDSAQILAPDSAVVLNNQIYCLSDQGVIRISGSSAAVISRGIENRINNIVDSTYDYTVNTFGVAYENDRAYILFTPQQSSDTSATQAYRYNIFEKTWSRWEYEATCGQVLKRDNKLYVGNNTRNYISQERKNNDRTDHSDRNFTATITTNGVDGTTVELSTLVNVKVNDVILQTQDVTIYYINWRLLKKMDYFDTGITAPSGFATMTEAFEALPGNNLATVMQNINDHLRTLDATYISNKTFTMANIRTNTELLVTELNTTGAISSIKTYKNPETVSFEAYITEIDSLRNKVTIHTERPFIEDDIEVYKGYTCTIEWNPQHFGNPAALKQVSHITILFDQNNFNAAIAKFYSDASQGTVEVPFSGKGLGYWGDMAWGENTAYWGGEGNDMPFRTIVPRSKQKCRYISVAFEHKIAREDFRVLGISGTVREISSKAYRQLK